MMIPINQAISELLVKSATYASLRGDIEVADASELADDYSIVFTNEAGKNYLAIDYW